MIIAQIKLDTYRDNNIPILKIPQGDYLGRRLKVFITALGERVKLSSSDAVTVTALRSDGASKNFTGMVDVSDGSAMIPIERWMLDIEGDVECWVSVLRGDSKYSTNKFLVEVQYSPGAETSGELDLTPEDQVVVEINARIATLDREINAKIDTLDRDLNSLAFDLQVTNSNMNAADKALNESITAVSNDVASTKTKYNARFLKVEGDLNVLSEKVEGDLNALSEKEEADYKANRLISMELIRPYADSKRALVLKQASNNIIFDYTTFPIYEKGTEFIKGRVPMFLKWYDVTEAEFRDYNFLTKFGIVRSYDVFRELYTITMTQENSILYEGPGYDVYFAESDNTKLVPIIVDENGNYVAEALVFNYALYSGVFDTDNLPSATLSVNTSDVYRYRYADGSYHDFKLVAADFAVDAAVRKEIEEIKKNVVQTTGDSENAVMSQKVTTSELNKPISISRVDGVEITGNILPLAVETKAGFYCQPLNGKVVFSENANYTSYKIYVQPKNYYISTRYIVVCDAYGNALNELQNITSIDISAYPEAVYVWFSCTASSAYINDKAEEAGVPTIKIKKFGDVEEELIPYWTAIGEPANDLALSGAVNSITKGLVFALSCNVADGFNNVAIVFSNNSTESLTVTVSTTSVTVRDEAWGEPYIGTYEHGLTIKDNLQIFLKFTGKNTLDVEVASGGAKYTKTGFNILKRYSCTTYIWATAGTITDTRITQTCTDINKNIWCFGDSYFAYSDTRWVKHLFDAGYSDNVLLNGFSGEGSPDAVRDLNSLLKLGKPQYVFWCMGMNDGADTDENTPNAAWLGYIQNIIATCSERGITPVLATIPTVPIKNHEGKNKWIRESGYQYVDFAKAVGASPDGTWFDEMLHTDGVHPTVKGGIALYYQVLTDFPQIMIG